MMPKSRQWLNLLQAWQNNPGNHLSEIVMDAVIVVAFHGAHYLNQ